MWNSATIFGALMGRFAWQLFMKFLHFVPVAVVSASACCVKLVR